MQITVRVHMLSFRQILNKVVTVFAALCSEIDEHYHKVGPAVKFATVHVDTLYMYMYIVYT